MGGTCFALVIRWEESEVTAVMKTMLARSLFPFSPNIEKKKKNGFRSAIPHLIFSSKNAVLSEIILFYDLSPL